MNATDENPARAARPGPLPDVVADSATGPVRGQPAARHAALFRRWLDLSELNRRVFLALNHEVSASSDLVEHGVIDLITCFQAMAAAAAAQARQLDHAAALVGADPAPTEASAPAVAEHLAAARAHAATIAEGVARMVTCLQFQDRTKQHLSHIGDTLTLLASAAAALRDDTRAQVDPLEWDGGLDEAWQRRILEGQTLGAVRERFLHRLLAADPAHPPAPAPASDGAGDIDLF